MYIPASTIECGQGYWVATISDHIVTIEGEQCTEWSRDLLTGWHLIGALFEDKPVSNLSPETSVLITYGFDPSIGQYVFTNNNGLKVNSGIYIYRIQAGSFTDVKKMIFLK